jgi:hypothetical protein
LIKIMSKRRKKKTPRGQMLRRSASRKSKRKEKQIRSRTESIVTRKPRVEGIRVATAEVVKSRELIKLISQLINNKY